MVISLTKSALMSARQVASEAAAQVMSLPGSMAPERRATRAMAPCQRLRLS